MCLASIAGTPARVGNDQNPLHAPSWSNSQVSFHLEASCSEHGGRLCRGCRTITNSESHLRWKSPRNALGKFSRLSTVGTEFLCIFGLRPRMGAGTCSLSSGPFYDRRLSRCMAKRVGAGRL